MEESAAECPEVSDDKAAEQHAAHIEADMFDLGELEQQDPKDVKDLEQDDNFADIVGYNALKL